MGNIEKWMTHSYLSNLLKSINVYPNHITIKHYKSKRGCAFLDFCSREMAKFVLTEYNNKEVKGIKLIFNWVRSLEQKFIWTKINKFTVSKNLNLFLIKQLFVGNIDKSIPFDYVKNFFYSKFSSIISAKLIVDQETGHSRGYAFFEFLSYKEFNSALNIKEPLIFGKQKLVLNSAKNKYDNVEEEIFKENYNMQFYEDRKSLDSLNLSNQTPNLSRTETGFSSLRNSKESNNSYNNKNRQENNLDEDNNELNFQIIHSLKKMSEQYYQYDNKPNLFNYYCSPFIYNSNFKNDLFINYIYKENSNDNKLYQNCPFELCRENDSKCNFNDTSI